MLSILDTFNRFMLLIPKHFYDIRFIKVINGCELKEPLMEMLQHLPFRLNHHALENQRFLCFLRTQNVVDGYEDDVLFFRLGQEDSL